MVPGGVPVETAALGGTHPAAMNRQNAVASTTTTQHLIFRQFMGLAQLRPNIAAFVQKETFLLAVRD
jgi:hypothetical protein